MHRFFWLALLAGAVLLVTMNLLTALQEKMLYFPDREIETTPESLGLPYEEVAFSSESYKLHGWWIPAPEQPARGTVLFFHGNAGNISQRTNTIGFWNTLGFHLLIFDYRGYGKSTGTPNEKGTYADALAAWNWLVQEKKVKEETIILNGRSLGGAIAASLAEQVSAGSLILESTFTSVPAMAKAVYPIVPTRWVTIHYNTLQRLQNIQTPVMITHSPDDDVIPFQHGQELFDHAKEPKSSLHSRGSTMVDGHKLLAIRKPSMSS